MTEDAKPTPPTPEDQPGRFADGPTPQPRRERARGFFSRLLRWALALLVIFGFGALLMTLLFYVPLQDQMNARQSDLAAANARIVELETEVERISGLQTTNEALRAQTDQADMRIALLSARTDVLTAQLALAREEPSKARLALSNTSKTLDKIKALLESNQQPAVNDMQSRLKLALDELDDNQFAAQSDLEVLLTALLEMENRFFAAP